ncbi:MAG: ABC transporter substrate-binding protein, partial [Pseudolysinimonas sp.]
MRIPVASGAAALAIVLALSGCSGSGAPAANIITASWSEPTSPLIPAETVDFGGARVIDNIFAGLVAYTADGTVVNDVADSIEIAAKPAKPAKSHKADKGQVYTVTLRDGLTFTDGEKVDAESFVSAWDWAADSANKTPYQSSFAGIVGYVADDPT